METKRLTMLVDQSARDDDNADRRFVAGQTYEVGAGLWETFVEVMKVADAAPEIEEAPEKVMKVADDHSGRNKGRR